MLYLPELYYFYQKEFPSEKAVAVTAKTVAVWCTEYKAELLAPRKGVHEKKREGVLPSDERARRQLIGELTDWIFHNSIVSNLFALFLYRTEVEKKSVATFDHHDDTCCWALHCTPQEFLTLQSAWRNAGLPDDLFYEEGKGVKVVRPPSIFDRFLAMFGFTGETSKIYTPKQWEQEQQKRLQESAQ